MSSVAGLLVRVRETEYFIPVGRVGFVAPIREVREGMLVMPNGLLPLIDVVSEDSSFAASKVAADAPPRRNAVALRAGAGFVALAVDGVELADTMGAALAKPISEIDPLLEARMPREPK